MGKLQSQRTHGQMMKKLQGTKSPSLVRAEKCQRTKSRTNERRKLFAATLAEKVKPSNAEQLVKLDNRLGKNRGAKKERTRLNGTKSEKPVAKVV